MENEKAKIVLGNATTVITSISLAFAGLIIGLLASFGLKLPIDQTSLAGVIGTIIMFIFSLINAKYHNNFFDDDTLTVSVDGLTEAQIKSIQNFVDNATKLNQQHNVFDNDAPVLNDEYIISEDEDNGC